jgi:hypothetical protein
LKRVVDLLLNVLATPDVTARDRLEDGPLIVDNRNHPRQLQLATVSLECNGVLYMM